MRVAFFDTHSFEREIFTSANRNLPVPNDLHFFEVRLQPQSVALADGFPAICLFVNDRLDAAMIDHLGSNGLQLVALRSAGFNHVDLAACATRGIAVVRVPAYSPHAVAEHALALLLTLNRKIHRAHIRVRELNFSLDGLVGFDLSGKTVGVIGTGKIGAVFARIMTGLSCRVLAFDAAPSDELRRLGVEYVDLETIFRASDVISLHVPLTPSTHHLVNLNTIELMKPGVVLINTGRGGLIDTKALIAGLKTGKVGAAGLDVYEEEENIFFRDLSASVLQDDVLARLLTFPNVLITAHQAFLTTEALRNIAETTLANISDFEFKRPLVNSVLPEAAPGE